MPEIGRRHRVGLKGVKVALKDDSTRVSRVLP
jgi:hypothetical protein